MAVTERDFARLGRDRYDAITGITVASSGDTNLIPSLEVFGMKGFFAVNNGSGNTITIYPRVSTDGTLWFELDNGSGQALLAGVKAIYAWTGNYRFVKLDATAISSSTSVDAYMYVSTE